MNSEAGGAPERPRARTARGPLQRHEGPEQGTCRGRLDVGATWKNRQRGAAVPYRSARRWVRGSRLRIRVLGRLDAWDGDVEVDLGGRRQRAVLAVLVLARGQAVPADRIADCLWGETSRRTPPARCSRTVAPAAAGSSPTRPPVAGADHRQRRRRLRRPPAAGRRGRLAVRAARPRGARRRRRVRAAPPARPRRSACGAAPPGRVRRRAVGRGGGRSGSASCAGSPGNGCSPRGWRRGRRRCSSRARGPGRRGAAARGAVAAAGARALPRAPAGGRAGGAAPGPGAARRRARHRPGACAARARGRGARPVAGARRPDPRTAGAGRRPTDRDGRACRRAGAAGGAGAVVDLLDREGELEAIRDRAGRPGRRAPPSCWSSRGPPGSARPGCSRRRGGSPRSRGWPCSAPGAASWSGRSASAPSGSCSSRCSSTRRAVSACCPARPRAPRAVFDVPDDRPAEGRSPSCTGSTG